MIVRKMLLSVLAVMPIASVSTAATSKLTEIEGEIQQDELRKSLLNLKQMLFPAKKTHTDLEKARQKFQESTGITDKELLEARLGEALRSLKEQGILFSKENELFSSIASGGHPGGTRGD